MDNKRRCGPSRPTAITSGNDAQATLQVRPTTGIYWLRHRLGNPANLTAMPLPMSSPIRVDSAEAKNFGKKCQMPGCFSRGTYCCSKCGHVRYCSTECQTKNWKIHKAVCQYKANLRNNIATADAVYRHLAISELLPSQVMEELRAIKMRFSMVLLTGAINCFRKGVDTLRFDWRTHLVTLNMRRRPSPPLKSRLWARYTVESVELTTWQDFLIEGGPQGSYDAIIRAVYQEKQNLRPRQALMVVQVKTTYANTLATTVFQERIMEHDIKKFFEVWPDWKGEMKRSIESISEKEGHLFTTKAHRTR